MKQNLAFTYKKERVFWIQLLKYLLIVLIIFLAYIPICFETINATKENIKQQSYYQFEAGAQQVNQMLVDLSVQGELISRDAVISRMTSIKRELEPKHFVDLIRAQQTVRNATATNYDIVKGAYIVSTNNDLLISNTLISTDRKAFYGEFYSIEAYDYAHWEKAIFDGSTGMQFIPDSLSNPVFTFHEMQTRQHIIHVVLPVSVSGASTRKAMVYMLDTERLIETIVPETLDGKMNDFVQLIDKDGKVIAERGFDQIRPELAAEQNTMMLNGQEYTRMQADFEDTGFKVVWAVPSSVFVEYVKPMYHFILALTFIILTTCLIAGIFLAYRQSRPIKSLLNVVEEVNPQTEERDYYKYITDTVVKLESTRRQNEAEIRQMSDSMKRNLLKQLIRGELHEPEELRRCHMLLGVHNNRFCIISLRIRQERMEREETRIGMDMMVQLGESACDHIRSELGFQTYILKDRSRDAVIIVAMQESSEQTLPQLSECMKAVISEAKLQNAYAGCGIGLVVLSPDSLRISAQQAVVAARCITTNAPVQTYQPQDMEEYRTHFSPIVGKKLYDMLVNGDKTGVETTLSAVIPNRTTWEEYDESEIMQLYYEIIGTLESAAKAVGIPKDAAGLPSIAVCIDVQEFSQAFHDSAMRICAYVRKKQERQTLKLQGEIVQFVEENYTNSGLCAQMVAQRFQVSEKYIFSAVKAATGMTLGELIEQRRFELVEKLLLSTDEISAIPQQVGYNSVNTFYKAFKRIYGVSPGQWRESARGLNESIPVQCITEDKTGR